VANAKRCPMLESKLCVFVKTTRLPRVNNDRSCYQVEDLRESLPVFWSSVYHCLFGTVESKPDELQVTQDNMELLLFFAAHLLKIQFSCVCDFRDFRGNGKRHYNTLSV